MKLVSTLPERVGFLYVTPVADLFGLLLVALLLGQSFVNEAGVQVELPVSTYQVSRTSDAPVITLSQGDPPVIWLDRERVTEEQLVERLAAMRDASGPVPSVMIRSDRSVPVGAERRIAQAALGADFRVYLLGQPGGE